MDGQSGAILEANITPEMLSEGVDAYLSFELESQEAQTVVLEIYRRMDAVRPKQSDTDGLRR